MNLLIKILFSSLLLLSLSCSQKKIEATEKSDKLKKSENSSTSSSSENSAPRFAKLIAAPSAPKIGGDKTISFSVTDQTPLKDVLIELGRVAKIDIDLDPGISGGVMINAKNRPLKEVLDRIAASGKLRYSFQNGVLYFERDLPYAKNYFVDFLSNSQLWSDVEANVSAILGDASGNSDSMDGLVTSRYTSNKSAGILSIFATKSQQESISKYLDDVYKNSSAQVLIEAKVVEVTLNKEFDTGINWSWVDAGKSFTTTGSFTSASSSTAAISATIPKVKLFGLGGNLSASVQALELFGKARSISSPRINAINNQKATLDFSQKLVYFTVSASSSTSVGTSSNTVSTVTATKNEVDVGAKLEITPSINLATNEITLDVKPKLSINSGQSAKDPSVNPTSGDSLGNTIPIINTRELSTIAKIQSGNTLVIGGLISDTVSDTNTGLPFLMRIPVLKYLFGYFSNSTSKVETVIFIKATIINSSGTMNKEYRDLHDDAFPTKVKKQTKLEKIFAY